jgi:para-aminobenzoate synthetase/4-amino-4-deoxychorismate lyase
VNPHRDLPKEWIERAGSSENAVLLETRRFGVDNYRSFLFTNPRSILQAWSPGEVTPLLEELETQCRRGCYAAGYVAYEGGGEDIGPAPRPAYPLAWFGLYEHPEEFDHRLGGPSPAGAPRPGRIDPDRLTLRIDREAYRRAVRTIHEHIREGDTYQINFTSAFEFPADHGAVPLYAALRQRQRVAYGALLRAGDLTILSFSPELFFRLSGTGILTRPMKGTSGRGRTQAEDDAQSEWLRNDPKNRSENIMIVDLLRNDLGRICTPGSVRTTELCAVERYETLLQMTSTVEGELRPSVTLGEMFRTLFPSGSVTGAPKIRSMQIINELEGRPRGVYTGAIGYVTPDRDAVFNVAIRTVVLHAGTGVMGTGSGIVIDSDPDEEFEECSLKGKFLTGDEEDFQLIETMLWHDTVPLLRHHLRRLCSSAAYFGFPFDEKLIGDAIAGATAPLVPGQRYRLRLLLDRNGEVRMEASPLVAGGAPAGGIAEAPVRTDSADPFLFHKTTRRELYESAYAQAQAEGFAEVVFLNERGELTECTRNNIYLLRGGVLVTPPVSCGLLGGVYRAHLLETTRVREELLTMADLAGSEAIYLSNAVHGLRPVAYVPGARLRRIPAPVRELDPAAARPHP